MVEQVSAGAAVGDTGAKVGDTGAKVGDAVGDAVAGKLKLKLSTLSTNSLQ